MKMKKSKINKRFVMRFNLAVIYLDAQDISTFYFDLSNPN